MLERSERAVVAEPGEPAGADVLRRDIRRYAFLSARLEVAAGTVVEWVNSDRMVHT